MRARLLLVTIGLLVAAPALAERLAIVGGTWIDVRDGGRSTADVAAATVLIDGDRIVAAGPSAEIKIAAGTRRIDARGRYVVPGLIDGFGALRSQGFASAYLHEGVTTVFLPEPSGNDARRGKPLLTADPAPRILLGSVITSYGQVDRSDDSMTAHRLNDPRRTRAELVALLEKLRADRVRAVLVHYDAWPDDVDVIVRETRRLGMGTIGELGFTSYHYAARAGVQSFVHTSRYVVELAPPDLRLPYADEPFGRSAMPAIRAAVEVDPKGPAAERYGKFLAESKVTLMPTLAMQLTSIRHDFPNPWRRPSAVLVKPEELHLPVSRETGLSEPPMLTMDPEMFARRQEVADYLPLLAEETLAFTPGARFAYSTSGFVLLGAIIEKASGQGYFDYIREHVYAPAGMKDTDCYEVDRDLPNLATGYTRDDAGGWRSNVFLHTMRGGPGGGGYSTVGDLARFATALKAGKLLPAARVAELTSGKVDAGPGKYTFGFGESVVRGHRIVGHNGGFAGISANMDIFWDDGWTVVVLANVDAGAMPVLQKARELIAR